MNLKALIIAVLMATSFAGIADDESETLPTDDREQYSSEIAQDCKEQAETDAQMKEVVHAGNLTEEQAFVESFKQCIDSAN